TLIRFDDRPRLFIALNSAVPPSSAYFVRSSAAPTMGSAAAAPAQASAAQAEAMIPRNLFTGCLPWPLSPDRIGNLADSLKPRLGNSGAARRSPVRVRARRRPALPRRTG